MSAKLKKFRYLIALFVTATIIGMLIYQYENNRVSLKQQHFRFEYGTKLPHTSDAYFKYSDKYEDVSFDEKLFALTDIGTYEIKVNFAQKEYTLSIEIADETAPEVQFLQDTALIYRNQDKLFGSFYEVADSSATESEIRLEKAESGQQEVCILAEDTHENKVKECKVMQVELKDIKTAEIPEVSDVKELIETFIKEKGLNESSFACFYYSVDDKESYLYNSKRSITAASTIKVPLNMLYEDAYVNKKMNPKQTIRLYKNDIEAGDGHTDEHKLNTPLSYEYLQQQSIVYSDNTATNMLVRALGGFYSFRKRLAEYSNETLPAAFYSQNIITAEYMNTVMKRLYQQRDRYHTLIDHMKQATPGEYLQASSDAFEIAQKYGLFEGVLHTVGIVYTPKPYTVGIFTMNRKDGQAIITELNKWLIAYQLQK